MNTNFPIWEYNEKISSIRLISEYQFNGHAKLQTNSKILPLPEYAGNKFYLFRFVSDIKFKRISRYICNYSGVKNFMHYGTTSESKRDINIKSCSEKIPPINFKY